MTLQTSREPFREKRNPMAFYGVKHVFNQIRLERVDNPERVQLLCARAHNAECAEILIGSKFIAEILEASQRMTQGEGDFCIGPSRSERWRYASLDRLTGDLWFWGERDTPNTF